MDQMDIRARQLAKARGEGKYLKAGRQQLRLQAEAEICRRSRGSGVRGKKAQTCHGCGVCGVGSCSSLISQHKLTSKVHILLKHKQWLLF